MALNKIIMGSNNRESKQKLIVKGILESILEIGPFYNHRDNGIIGPGYQSYKKIGGSYTKLKIRVGSGFEHVTYKGIILPDSIGNEIEVFESDKRNTILDKTLQRWYR